MYPPQDRPAPNAGGYDHNYGHDRNWTHGSTDRNQSWFGRGDRDHYRYFRSDHDDWRDIFFGGGIDIDLNLMFNDDYVYFDGSYGDLYPVYEYDEDCDSSNLELRARAELFSHPFFYRDGHRFERRTISRNGERYYQFFRVG